MGAKASVAYSSICSNFTSSNKKKIIHTLPYITLFYTSVINWYSQNTELDLLFPPKSNTVPTSLHSYSSLGMWKQQLLLRPHEIQIVRLDSKRWNPPQKK